MLASTVQAPVLSSDTTCSEPEQATAFDGVLFAYKWIRDWPHLGRLVALVALIVFPKQDLGPWLDKARAQKVAGRSSCDLWWVPLPSPLESG